MAQPRCFIPPYHGCLLLLALHQALGQGIGKDVGPRAQRTPMGKPYISSITRGYLWVSYPQESLGVPQYIPW